MVEVNFHDIVLMWENIVACQGIGFSSEATLTNMDSSREALARKWTSLSNKTYNHNNSSTVNRYTC